MYAGVDLMDADIMENSQKGRMHVKGVCIPLLTREEFLELPMSRLNYLGHAIDQWFPQRETLY